MAGLALWLALRAGRATVVQTRAELDDAVARAPRWIVVEGSEALRAYAATLAYRGSPDFPWTPTARDRVPAGRYAASLKVGRITDGLRPRPVSRPEGQRRGLLTPGLRSALLATLGLSSAFAAEVLRLAAHPDLLVRLAVILLVLVAVAALAWVAWQATGLGRPAHTSWRVQTRVQGRLVMARVRTATA